MSPPKTNRGKTRSIAALIGVMALTAAAVTLIPAGSSAGNLSSPIKALSPAELGALLAGQGMGLAKAAELNDYPGPRHVLDLGEEIGLTPEQRRATERLMASVQVTAQSLGRRVVDAEAALDAAFASGRADEEEVADRVREIASMMGELRLTHLSAHIAMRRILEPDQIARYAELRGYTAQRDTEEGEHRHDG
jgi:Spy/CpxP family protein refolding chaperone